MSNNGIEPYVEFKPGDLIAAEVMNDMQRQIRQDIGDQSQAAVDNIESVPYAENAGKLENQTLDDIRKEIIDQALSQMALHSGYMRVYKKLKFNVEALIEHGLKNNPLVDIYQLDYFLVIASEDGYIFPTWVNFYLYHSSEKRIRYRPEDSNQQPVSIEIEPSSSTAYRIPFKEMLARYNVKYNDGSSVGEIETEFWDALFAAPNDIFDDNQYTHSPWFDRCCREERTVKSLKQKGDWDDLWIKVVPRKTINFDRISEANDQISMWPAPPDLKVCHFDWNQIGIKLLKPLAHLPIDPEQTLPGIDEGGNEGENELANLFKREFPNWDQELKIMVLLRA